MTSFKKLLSKPATILPIVAILAVVIGIFTYRHVGVAPQSNIALESGVTNTGAGDSSDLATNLAFPLSGRVKTVSVKTGDHVAKGQVLASLDAGSAQGTLKQAQGALELAQAQYASLDIQYSNAKKQQDTLVTNAYRTLLSSNLQAMPIDQDTGQAPIISGTYTCGNEGIYTLAPYRSAAPSGYSMNVTGLETDTVEVTLNAPQPLGSCGLLVQFTDGIKDTTKWAVRIPNIDSPSYVANKNAYDLAVSTREQVLTQYAANLGKNGSSAANVAKAAVDAAEGAYQSALGAYNNSLIVAPITGTVTFVDADLKAGQSIVANKTVISISQK